MVFQSKQRDMMFGNMLRKSAWPGAMVQTSGICIPNMGFRPMDLVRTSKMNKPTNISAFERPAEPAGLLQASTSFTTEFSYQSQANHLQTLKPSRIKVNLRKHVITCT